MSRLRYVWAVSNEVFSSGVRWPKLKEREIWHVEGQPIWNILQIIFICCLPSGRFPWEKVKGGDGPGDGRTDVEEDDWYDYVSALCAHSPRGRQGWSSANILTSQMRRQRKWWSKSSGTCSEPIIRTSSSLLPALLDLGSTLLLSLFSACPTSLRTFLRVRTDFLSDLSDLRLFDFFQDERYACPGRKPYPATNYTWKWNRFSIERWSPKSRSWKSSGLLSFCYKYYRILQVMNKNGIISQQLVCCILYCRILCTYYAT